MAKIVNGDITNHHIVTVLIVTRKQEWRRTFTILVKRLPTLSVRVQFQGQMSRSRGFTKLKRKFAIQWPTDGRSLQTTGKNA